MSGESKPNLPEQQGIASIDHPLQNLSAQPVDGLYFHVPFCVHKCHYCDFYSIVDERDRQTAFTRRMMDECRWLSGRISGPIRTIFVGGGTPTLLISELWHELLAELPKCFDLSVLKEFTVEANPETVEPPLLEVLVAGGVNRISLGVQSFDPRHLKALERRHDPASVPRAVKLARQAGIANLNLDLIFGVPGAALEQASQSLDEARADLDAALELEPDHLSVYGLTYEPNTPLTQKLRSGRIEACDADLEADLFMQTIRVLGKAGFEQYEISNFARPGHQCEHNLMYWRNGQWAALGPSASGHVAGVRWKNKPHLGAYLASQGPVPVEEVESLDAAAALGEKIMLGLRLREGMPWSLLQPQLDEERRMAIERLQQQGMLEIQADRLRLSDRGLLLADGVIAELI